MRIVIDLQGAQTESRYRGIGRYSLSLAQAIARQKGCHEVIIALNGLFPETILPLRAVFRDLLSQDCIRTWYYPAPVREIHPGNRWRRKAAEMIRGAFFESLKPDILIVSSLFEGYADDAVVKAESQRFEVAVVLYDLIPLLNPEIYLAPDPVFEKFYRKQLTSLLNVDYCLAISESSAREGVDALGFQKERVTNISAACDPVFHPLSLSPADRERTLSRFGIKGDFIMYTGGFDERKNLPRLIESFALLPENLRTHTQLVLAGKIPEGNLQALRRKAAAKDIGEKELLCPGYIKDDELVLLYNLCSLFVLPSLHEGFGLPLLEAMSCGAPVIGADSSSIPEVIGWDGALFDPLDERALSEKMRRALEDGDFRRELIQNSAEQAKKFSWDLSAKKAIGFLETARDRSKASVRHQVLPSPEVVATKIAAACGEHLSEQGIEQTAWALCLNHPDPGPIRLFVDISELCQRDSKSGVQRVTRSVLKHLLNAPPGGCTVLPVYATLEKTGYLHARKYTETFLGREGTNPEDLPIDFRSGDILLGLDLQHHVVQRQKSCLEEMHRAGLRIYFVVYDLLPVLLPQCFLPGTRAGHEEWLRTVCGFDGALCISRSVAEELRLWQKENLPGKERFDIGWFHLGADVENSVPSKGIPKDGGKIVSELSSGITILMVGTIEPRKGYTQALDAMDVLWEEGEEINLVIVGRQGWLTEQLCMRIRCHKQSGKRLFWLDNASDEFLEKLYDVSSCLLAASEGEGFGLPLIEAAKHRLPIIARDIPVFREVAGEHALYFSCSDGKTLAGSVRKWKSMYNQNVHPKSEGLPRLNWSRSAEQITQYLFARNR